MPFIGNTEMWFEFRGYKVTFYSDLSYLFSDLRTPSLKQIVKKNINIFSPNSIIQLTESEIKQLKEQYETSNESHVIDLPIDERLDLEKVWFANNDFLPFLLTEVGVKDLFNLLGQDDEFIPQQDVWFANRFTSINEKINYWKRRIAWFNDEDNEVQRAKAKYPYLTFAEGEIKRLKAGIKKQNELSYVWLDSPGTELPELYQKMMSIFIALDTTIKQFTAIFTGQLIKTITPVRWHEDNASELLYFILKLEEIGLIETTGKTKILTNYKRLKSCFVKPDGNYFEANFKELKQTIEITLSDHKIKAIDELLMEFS